MENVRPINYEVDQDLICRRFSRCAAIYDLATPRQAEMGERLMKEIEMRLTVADTVLVIGCGTRRVTAAVKVRHPQCYLSPLT